MSVKEANNTHNRSSDLSELKTLLFQNQQNQLEQKIAKAEETAHITAEKIAHALPDHWACHPSLCI